MRRVLINTLQILNHRYLSSISYSIHIRRINPASQLTPSEPTIDRFLRRSPGFVFPMVQTHQRSPYSGSIPPSPLWPQLLLLLLLCFLLANLHRHSSLAARLSRQCIGNSSCYYKYVSMILQRLAAWVLCAINACFLLL